MISFVIEFVGKNPRLCAVFFDIRSIRITAIINDTDHKPNASHDMAQINNVQDKSSETGQIVLSLL